MNIGNWFHPSYLIDFTNEKNPHVREATGWERFVSFFKNLSDKYFLSSNDAKRLAGKVSAADPTLADPTLINKISTIQKDLIYISLGKESSTQQKKAAQQINDISKINTLLPSLIKTAEEYINAYESVYPNFPRKTPLKESLALVNELKDYAPNEARALVKKILSELRNPEIMNKPLSPEEIQAEPKNRHAILTRLLDQGNYQGFMSLYDFLLKIFPEHKNKKKLQKKFLGTRISFDNEKLKNLLSATEIDEGILRSEYYEISLKYDLPTFAIPRDQLPKEYTMLCELKTQCRKKLFTFDIKRFQERASLEPTFPSLKTDMEFLIYNIDFSLAEPDALKILKDPQYTFLWKQLAEKGVDDFLASPLNDCEFLKNKLSSIKEISPEAYDLAIERLRTNFSIKDLDHVSITCTRLRLLKELFPENDPKVLALIEKFKALIKIHFFDNTDADAKKFAYILLHLRENLPDVYQFAINLVKKKILTVPELAPGLNQDWVLWEDYAKIFLNSSSYPELKTRYNQMLCFK